MGKEYWSDVFWLSLLLSRTASSRICRLYGAVPAMTVASCSGVCSSGYSCPAGSTAPNALVNICPAGQYSAAGDGVCSNCKLCRWTAGGLLTTRSSDHDVLESLKVPCWDMQANLNATVHLSHALNVLLSAYFIRLWRFLRSQLRPIDVSVLRSLPCWVLLFSWIHVLDATNL